MTSKHSGDHPGDDHPAASEASSRIDKAAAPAEPITGELFPSAQRHPTRTSTLRTVLLGVAALAVVGIGTGVWVTWPRTVSPADLPNHAPDLANGERMFYAGGCASCHAAPGSSGDAKKVLAGGLELPSPFGTFHVPNISPDPTFGIGGWTDAQFITAMVKGTSPSGEHLYPAFPYTSYQRMTYEDLIDLKAYLDTLPKSDNRVAGHDLPFPFGFRPLLGAWKFLYLDGEPFTPDPNAVPLVNRGAYLVKGPGHCGECHTPRTMLGGLEMNRWLAGGPNPEGTGSVPNITAAPSGVGNWSVEDVANLLETGFTPDFDSVGGSMGPVIDNWSHVPLKDREAVGAYLLSLPPS